MRWRALTVALLDDFIAAGQPPGAIRGDGLLSRRQSVKDQR